MTNQTDGTAHGHLRWGDGLKLYIQLDDPTSRHPAYNPGTMSRPTGAPAHAYRILSECVAGRTHKISRVVDSIFNEALRPLGIRNTQLTMLSVIAFMGTATAAELAPVLVMEKSTVSRNLRVMTARGWIAGSDGAGRGRRIGLTRAGEKMLRQAVPLWQAAQAKAEAALGAGALNAIREIGDNVGVIPNPGESG